MSSPLGPGRTTWHPGSGLPTPVSQMRQSPLPPSLRGRSGAAIIMRIGPAGADVARVHLRDGGSPDALIEAAALSLAQAAVHHGTIDHTRYSAWVHQHLPFLSQIPNAAALFGTVADAQRTVASVMAHRPATVGGPPHQQGQPSRPAVQQNALMSVARPPPRLGSPHNSLYSR